MGGISFLEIPILKSKCLREYSFSYEQWRLQLWNVILRSPWVQGREMWLCFGRLCNAHFSLIDGSLWILMASLPMLYTAAWCDWAYAISALIELLSLVSLICMHSPFSPDLFGVYRGADSWWSFKLMTMPFLFLKPEQCINNQTWDWVGEIGRTY